MTDNTPAYPQGTCGMCKAGMCHACDRFDDGTCPCPHPSLEEGSNVR